MSLCLPGSAIFFCTTKLARMSDATDMVVVYFCCLTCERIWTRTRDNVSSIVLGTLENGAQAKMQMGDQEESCLQSCIATTNKRFKHVSNTFIITSQLLLKAGKKKNTEVPYSTVFVTREGSFNLLHNLFGGGWVIQLWLTNFTKQAVDMYHGFSSFICSSCLSAKQKNDDKINILWENKSPVTFQHYLKTRGA